MTGIRPILEQDDPAALIALFGAIAGALVLLIFPPWSDSATLQSNLFIAFAASWLLLFLALSAFASQPGSVNRARLALLISVGAMVASIALVGVGVWMLAKWGLTLFSAGDAVGEANTVRQARALIIVALLPLVTLGFGLYGTSVARGKLISVRQRLGAGRGRRG